ncbi:hypothetical protein [Sporosarcina sp. FSL W7-1283]
MELVRRMNELFIADRDEEVHWSMYVTFYGFYAFVLTVFLYTMITVL